MATEIILPRVDMDMTHGKITRWHVAEGDTVSKGQPLFEIETDKAAMEIEAQADGVVRGQKPTGEEVAVGTAVAWLCAPDEHPPEASAEQASPPQADAASVEAKRPAAEPVPEEAALGYEGRPRATPAARSLAAQRELDLAALAGSGPNGRIQRADVEAAASSTGRTSTAKLAIRQLREGAGDPLVLLHGFGAETASWRPLLGHLRLVNPVMGLDLPSHGQSPASPIDRFTSLADQVGAALAAARLVKLHLCGHSLGGAVAAALCDDDRFEVRSLCLMSPAGLGPSINQTFLDGFCGAASEAALAVWMRELVADPASLPDAMVRSTWRARDGNDQAAGQSNLAARLFAGGTQLFSVRPALERHDGPLRILSGSADRIIDNRAIMTLSGGAAAIHLLPGIGHLPQIEAANLAARLVAETVRSAS